MNKFNSSNSITSASIGTSDPAFFMKLKEVIEDIKNTLKEGISDGQRLYFAEEIVKLQSILDSENNKVQLRPIQRRAIQNIITMLKKGQNEGYVKLPTGVGKTILFVSMIEALGQATLIMVPTKDLVGQTADVFKSDFAYDEESIKTINPNNGKSSSSICQDILNDIGDTDFKGVIVTTNDSLKSIFKSNLDLFAQLRDKIDIYVTDEAHRALGNVHRDMLENGLYDNDNQKLHLMFTATPQLRNKNVGDYYEEIINVSLGEAIKEGILVMPQFKGVGKAILNTAEGEEIDTVTQEFLDKNSLKFVDENGKYIYEKLVDEYIDTKENIPYQYAPGIGICATIEQAEFIKNYLISRGIRAIRVTSANKEYDEGYSSEEAKKMLMADQVDIVVTVTKVAEGWDVPTMRNIIRFTPTLSQARQIQSFGRILRNVEWRHIEAMIKAMNDAKTNTTLNERELSEMLLKRSDNTFLIEADSWQVRNSGKKAERENEKKGLGATAEQGHIVYTHPNTVQALFNEGELGYDEIKDFFGNVDIQDKLPEVGEDGKVEIDGEVYQWVGANAPNPFANIIGMQSISKIVENQSDEWKRKFIVILKTNGKLIRGCLLKELNSLLKDRIDIPLVGKDGKIEIDGEAYQWVGSRTPINQIGGINGWELVKVLDKQTDIWKSKYIKKAKQLNGVQVNTYNLIALEKIINDILFQKHNLYDLGKKDCIKIDGIEFVQITDKTPPKEIWGLSGYQVITELNKQPGDWRERHIKKALKGGKIIAIYDLLAVKKIVEKKIAIPRIGINGKVIINGKEYQRIGVNTPSNEIRGFSGKAVDRKIRNQSRDWKEKFIKSAKPSMGPHMNVCEITALKDLLGIKD